MNRFVLAVALLGCTRAPLLELEVHSIVDASDEPGFVPIQAGNGLIAVELTLTNRTEERIPMSFELFFIEPASGDPIGAHPATAELLDGCVAMDVLPGASRRCRVAFEV